MGKHCAAVELLLARMDSNPEEFTETLRWQKFIDRYKSILPATDRIALEDKLNSLYLEVFHKAVMNELLAEPREDFAMVSLSPDNSTIYSYTNATNQSLSNIATAMGEYAKRSV